MPPTQKIIFVGCLSFWNCQILEPHLGENFFKTKIACEGIFGVIGDDISYFLFLFLLLFGIWFCPYHCIWSWEIILLALLSLTRNGQGKTHQQTNTGSGKKKLPHAFRFDFGEITKNSQKIP